MRTVDVDKMLRSITAKQLAWWEAYASLEPFEGNAVRLIYQIAQVAQILVNVNRNPDKQPAAKLEDLILPFGDPEDRPQKPKQTNEEKISIFRALEAAFSSAKG